MAKYACTLADVTKALSRIRPYIHRTPLMRSTTLDKMTGHNIFLKTENFQKTGSFKFRGAMNAVLKIKENSPEVKCVITDSSGNHGIALACAARKAGLTCYVVMTKISPKCKIEAAKEYGANVVLCEASEEARKQGSNELCQKHNGVYIGSSQSRDAIAGQGTIAIEILEQNPDIDVIVAAIGGGGMIAGIATAKERKSGLKIIGAEPELASDCYASKKKGILTSNVTFPTTIADGAKASVNFIAWPMIRDNVDDIVTVSEKEIKRATHFAWQRCKLVAEPTAGVAVAASLCGKFKDTLVDLYGDSGSRNVAVVVCGGNVDFSLLENLLS